MFQATSNEDSRSTIITETQEIHTTDLSVASELETNISNSNIIEKPKQKVKPVILKIESTISNLIYFFRILQNSSFTSGDKKQREIKNK